MAVFRVKICGITRVEDARSAVEAGADAVGLNFFPKSKRYVDLETATALSAAVAGEALVVGVFVNATHQEIAETARAARLDAVQLHGDETPEFAANLASVLPIVRAHRCDSDGLAPLARWIEVFEGAGQSLAGALVDAPAPPGVYGGTGHQADWQAVAAGKTELGHTPLILAGGLNPENVAEAIELVSPAGVDTASGVESAPGIKDPALVRPFVSRAQEALG